MSSNQNYVQLFGPVNGNNLRARAMILDVRNIVLSPVIDEIIRVHNIEPYVDPVMTLVLHVSDNSDILKWWKTVF